MINLSLIEPYDKILCAVSGGADSMAMLHCFLQAQAKLNLEIFVCHLNHKTRDGDSDLDALFVENYCKKHNIPFLCKEISIKNTVGLGFEASARNARYDFFDEALLHFGASKIATAHNLNDNLETQLINLTRGTGICGLIGIPEIRLNIIRPLLNVSRIEIDDYILKNCLKYVVDKTNATDIYTRNKIRNNIIPILQQINPNVLKNAQNTASNLKTDEDFLENEANKSYNLCVQAFFDEFHLDIKAYSNLHSAISFRVLKLILKNFEKTLTTSLFMQFSAFSSSENPSATFSQISGIEIYRVYEKIIFKTTNSIQNNVDFIIKSQQITIATNKFTNLDYKCYADYDKIDINSIFISFKNQDDCISLPFGSKSLKKLFIDKKIPRFEREFVPILRDKNGIIAVCFIGTDKTRVLNNTFEIIFRSKDYEK